MTVQISQVLAGFAALVLTMDTQADARSDYAAALAGWQTVLQTYVDGEGRTDIEQLADDPALLNRYVATVRDYGPATVPEDFASRASVLAYHINTYNALAMHGVIDEGIPADFDSFFKRAGFFRFRTVEVDGDKTNLYDYENKVIRPLNEPRIHFALNCMVRDCPRLPQSAFTPEDLDAELEAATREFVNSDKYVRADDTQQRIYVSAIFDFYTEDFVPSARARDLPDYINRYRDTPLPRDYAVEYLDYDWTINQGTVTKTP